ncbi:MAG: aminoglycoside phosphotransferase family protein [Asgard group archaeon]|nr:aminoglycoside phosphotransferase family protein [Asgard group archaeon]
MPFKTDISVTHKQISTIFSEHFPNEKIQRVEEITRSFINPVYCLTLSNNQKYLLKINNESWPYKLLREEKAISFVAEKTSVPVPHIIASKNKSSQIPFSYLIEEFCPGKELDTALKENLLTKKQFLNIIHQIGSHLGKLHSLTFDFYGDIFTWDYFQKTAAQNKANSYLWGKRFASWKKCFKAYCLDNLFWVDHKSFPTYREALVKKIDDFTAKLPVSTQRCFIHSDIQTSNILIQDTKISAIVDFEWSFAGDPSFDFIITQQGLLLQSFPSLSLHSTFTKEDFVTPQQIKDSFTKGYSSTNSNTILSMPPYLSDFIWLLYMIGTWKWCKRSSTPQEIALYKKQIRQIYRKLIKS